MNKPLVLAASLALTLAAAADRVAAAPPAPAGPPPASRAIAVPAAPGDGKPREVRVLFESPALKLATITLRKGTVLPEHAAPVPVTITALSGSGTVTVGAERLPLDREHVVYLGPGVAHAVVPEAGSDMLLLVHHLGGGEDHHEGGHGDHAAPPRAEHHE